MEANEVIEKLGLVPLPEEGGFYIETHRDPHSTCIYYLVTPEEFSGLHAVKSAEIFHFYAGDPVEMVQINEEGELSKVILGSDLSKDQSPQVIVPPMIWQGTKLIGDGKWALLGCTVSPAFQFEDFFTATCEELSKKFPEHKDIIKDYTHSQLLDLLSIIIVVERDWVTAYIKNNFWPMLDEFTINFLLAHLNSYVFNW